LGQVPKHGVAYLQREARIGAFLRSLQHLARACSRASRENQAFVLQMLIKMARELVRIIQCNRVSPKKTP
jgi:hypothetical protein